MKQYTKVKVYIILTDFSPRIKTISRIFYHLEMVKKEQTCLSFMERKLALHM